MKVMMAQFAPVAVLGAGVILISGMREQYVTPPTQPMSAITRTFAWSVYLSSNFKMLEVFG